MLNFESVLPQFTAKCFEKKLISTNDKDTSNNTRQPSFDRSRALLDRILTKIEIDSEWYVVLLNILQDFPELERIRCELNDALLLSTLRNRKLSKTLHSLDPNRRYTHLGVLVEQSSPYNSDSGIADPDRIDYHRKYDVSEQSSSTPPRSQCEDPHDDYTSNRVPTSTGLYLSPGDSWMSNNTSISIESTEDPLPPVQTTSQQDDHRQSIQMTFQPENSPVNTSQEVSQDPILIPEHIALQELEESIKKIEEDLLKQRKWLEEQGEKVSEQDNIIENLRKDCDQKDEIVRDFKKDRAEKEKIIENLKARCEEAEREQAKNEEKMERIQREHKNEIADLQKNIDELKQKEEDARFELEKAKRSLIEAELRKEKEVNELRNTYHQQEKLKLELEVALKQKEKELAEEKTKRAQEAADYEKKERLFVEERERVEKESLEKSHRHETEELKQHIRELEERQQQQQQHKCCTIL